MAISDRAKEIVDHIYIAYGSHSGILFGIPADCRSAVEAVVQVTLDMVTQAEEADIKHKSGEK